MTDDKYMIYKNDIGYSVYKRCKIEGEEAERPIITQVATVMVHAKDKLKSENMTLSHIPEPLMLRIGLVQQYKIFEENGRKKQAELTQQELTKMVQHQDMMTQNIVGLVSRQLQQTEDGEKLEYKSDEIRDFALWCYNHVSVDIPALMREVDGQKDLEEYMEENL